MGYSLQGTRKVQEGASHPDRNAQFEYINEQVKAFQQAGQPVVSVDAKKKELVGDFANEANIGRKVSLLGCVSMTFQIKTWARCVLMESTI
jgi:hypothetical protein